jgi:hypothetical protein
MNLLGGDRLHLAFTIFPQASRDLVTSRGTNGGVERGVVGLEVTE